MLRYNFSGIISYQFCHKVNAFQCRCSSLLYQYVRQPRLLKPSASISVEILDFIRILFAIIFIVT
jgi:hypothetical protein